MVYDGFFQCLQAFFIEFFSGLGAVRDQGGHIYVFNSFLIVYTMTKGAPNHKTDTMITYLYMLSFYERKKGPATALSVIGFLILCVCAGIYMMTVMRKEEEL